MELEIAEVDPALELALAPVVGLGALPEEY